MAFVPFDRAADAAVIELFEMSLDHLCVSGFDGYFVRVSPSWTRTLGWSVEELLARPTIELVHPDDRAATLAARGRLHDGRAMGPLVNRYLCKDGSYRWFEWRSIAAPERRVVYAAARDITEQRSMEESLRASRAHEVELQRQLVIADRMASVGTLAAGAAHEINNPLASVMANLELMLEALPAHAGALGPAAVEDLAAMARDALAATETIRKVIRGLKTFSRTPVERAAVLDVQPVLELAVGLTANTIQQRARLVKAYGPTPPVDADETRLGQVFVNLLMNAAQAIPEGDHGRHEIRIVTATSAAGDAVIEIHDTGRGIPASSIDRIFDPFFTTKPVGTGTGLGLSVCHNVVTSCGGSIAVTSDEGRGAVFRVVLPPARPAAHVAPAPSPPLATAARARVLVVDDEVLIGRSFQRVLGEHDVSVVTAAAEALALLDAGEAFDVILSDLMMPEMSGMELHDEVARRFPALAGRMVFISGGAFTSGASTFLARVPNERFEKPIDADTLRAVVRRFVR